MIAITRTTRMHTQTIYQRTTTKKQTANIESSSSANKQKKTKK